MQTAPTIKELEWKPHPAGLGGNLSHVAFDNGYTASVIKGGPFYTDGGTYEVAVLFNDNVIYDTPITDDVLGYLSEEEANKAIRDISELPKRSVEVSA